MRNTYLCHHGVKGQKWGVRRFENEDGTLTDEGKARYGNSINNILNDHQQRLREISVQRKNDLSKLDKKSETYKDDKKAIKSKYSKDVKDSINAYQEAVSQTKKGSMIAKNLLLSAGGIVVGGAGVKLAENGKEYGGYALAAIGGAMFGSGIGNITGYGLASALGKKSIKDKQSKLNNKFNSEGSNGIGGNLNKKKTTRGVIH